MATLHHNISGELTQELLAAGEGSRVSRISFCNVQKVSKCNVDLYIEKQLEGKFYLLKGTEISIGTTLTYNNAIFDNTSGQFGLYIKLIDGATFTLTGSINPTGTNINVPGTNTLFLSELSVGDEIVVSGETRVIAGITSNTAATVTVAWGSDLSNDTSPDCNPTALVDVIMN